MHPLLRPVLQKLTTGLLLCAVVGEVGLRLGYPTLPSISSLPADPSPGAECSPNANASSPHPAWTQRFEGDSQRSFHIVVSGDSIALGSGVETHQSFSWLLGEKLAKETGLEVHVTNLSINGGGACDTLGRLLAHLNHEEADFVLAVFFSDDLQQYEAVSQQGQLHLDPEQFEELPAQRILTHSYLANWTWWQTLKHANVPTHQPLNLKTSEIQNGLDGLSRHVSETESTILFALLAPTGATLCSGLRPDSRPLAECRELASGGEKLHTLLAPLGDDYMDLRTLWNTVESPVQAQEADAMEEIQRLPIHPNIYGHQAIADTLWPALSMRINQNHLPH